MFNTYVDELSILFPSPKAGYHIGRKTLNNFSHEEDFAILATSARAINKILVICDVFVNKNLFEYSAVEIFALLILPKTFKFVPMPNFH